MKISNLTNQANHIQTKRSVIVVFVGGVGGGGCSGGGDGGSVISMQA